MAKQVFELDILQKEKDEDLPYWLDPSQRYDPNSERSKAIREKHRLAWLAKREAKKAFDKALNEVEEKDWDESKHPRVPGGEDGGQFTSGGGGGDDSPDDQGGSGATGPLTKLDKTRLNNWLGDGYRAMRYDKRFGETLAKLPKVNGKVYRGTRLDNKELAKLKIGATYKIDKYSSTSQRRDSAKAFMSAALHSEEKQVSVFFEIQDSGYKIPKDIAEFAGTADEAEVVLPIGDKYKIESVEKADPNDDISFPHVVVKMKEVHAE